MDIGRIINPDCCRTGFKARDKEEALRGLARLALASPLLEAFDEQTIFTLLKAREDEGTTGFGNEIAIPHARVEGMSDFLLLCATSVKGVDFDSLDKKKVKLFFVILGPAEKVNDHLQILASLSRTLSKENVRKEILSAKSKEVLIETIYKHRAGEREAVSREKMKLMFIVLYIDDFLYSILEYFIESGVDGATIIDSSGMGEYISNIPLFATFIGFMNEKKNHSKTIMALIPEERENEMVEGIENITGDLDRKEGAMILTTDISLYKGTMKMM